MSEQNVEHKSRAANTGSSPLIGSASRGTSIEAMAIKGMESRLRKLADHMDETAEALELCENNVGIEGSSAKAEEMRGAATVVRDWADHVIQQNVELTCAAKQAQKGNE